MMPIGRREWAFLFIGVLLALVALLAIGARYEVIAAGTGAAFKLDRWTGELTRCIERCGQ